MTLALLLGLGLGLGSWLVVSGLHPALIPLERALAGLNRRRPDPLGIQADRRPGVLVRLLGDTWLDSPLGRRLTDRAAADLRVTGTSPAEHLASTVAIGLTGLLWRPSPQDS